MAVQRDESRSFPPRKGQHMLCVAATGAVSIARPEPRCVTQNFCHILFA